MSTISQGSSTLVRKPAWIEAREMWASLAIVSIWLAVLVTAVFGPDIRSNDAGGNSTTIPSAVVVALFALFAAVVVAGCMYPKSAEPPAALTPAELAKAREKYPDLTAESVSAGRDLFVAHCGECHDHPDVAAVPDAEWPGIAREMAEKAELKPGEGDSVLRFIQAVRASR